jgi:hypothetical protein
MIAAWLGWSFAIVIIGGGPVLAYGFTQADRLVRAEHEFHPEAWERDGAPCGFFSMPVGCRTRVPLNGSSGPQRGSWRLRNIRDGSVAIEFVS